MTDLDSIASDILSRREKIYKLDFHDADWSLALETKQCLIDAVKGICEDEHNYFDAAMSLKGHMDEREKA